MPRLPALVWFCLGAVSSLVAANLLYASLLQPAATGSQQDDAPASAAAMTAVRLALKRPRVVAGFTTFPLGTRMAFVGDMLRSLADQSWPLDAVVMSLPERVERLSDQRLEIPPEAHEWARQYSWLKVHQTRDRGPATKLLGALELEADPDTIVVILDDDTFYHKDTVLALVSAMLASPADVAPCFRCEEVRVDWLGRRKWSYLDTERRCRGFASGYAAYAVRPRFFDDSVWNHSSGPAGCRLHDDVWISGSMLAATGVRPYLVKPGFDSIKGEYIAQVGVRQKESVHVADKAAQSKGQSPQGDCVAHFPFAAAERD